MEFNKNEQYAIISVLIAIMEADGVIHPNETAYLNKILKEFSISESEIEEIPNFDSLTVTLSLRSMTDGKKELAQQLFIGMAKCDGYADPRELKIIADLGN